jgi:hypothetical protein
MDDTIVNILLYLDEQELLAFSIINKKYNNLGQNLYFWGLKFKLNHIPMINMKTFDEYKLYFENMNDSNSTDISMWFTILDDMIENREEAIDILQINKEQFQREENWAYRKSKGQIIIRLDEPMDLYFLPKYINSLELIFVFTLNNTLNGYSLSNVSYTEAEMVDILTYFLAYQKIGNVRIIEEWRYTKK